MLDTSNTPGYINHADAQLQIYEARHTELYALENMLDEHLEELKSHYATLKEPSFGDTIAFYSGVTMCEKFKSMLHKMHRAVTDDQFYNLKFVMGEQNGRIRKDNSTSSTRGPTIKGDPAEQGT